MGPDSEIAAEAVTEALVACLPPGVRLCVAFSGGRDSSVLLHALAGLRASRGFHLRSIHVNHGLQANALEWEQHCAALAARLGVPFSALRVVVAGDGGRGLEAAAREARYAALRAVLQPAEYLLTAHHADDQLETVLLHLLRGSGVGGMAGIPGTALLPAGRLCRPLLMVPGEAVARYANHVLTPRGYHWLADPMNADPAFDRSYLRLAVLPAVRRRWPAAARGAGRSAVLAAEASQLLDELAALDQAALVTAGETGCRVSLAGLQIISPARQRNLLRYVARQRGWAVPPDRRLRSGLQQLLEAGEGKQPVLRFAGHEIRRFREHMYLLDAAVPAELSGASPLLAWPGRETLSLGGPRGSLSLQPGPRGLLPDLVLDGLQVTFRHGGETVRAPGDAHHRTLKYLFQSRGIVPWMRYHVPLVFARGQLAAVADLWTADWAIATPAGSGLQVVWTGHAPIV